MIFLKIPNSIIVFSILTIFVGLIDASKILLLFEMTTGAVFIAALWILGERTPEQYSFVNSVIIQSSNKNKDTRLVICRILSRSVIFGFSILNPIFLIGLLPTIIYKD